MVERRVGVQTLLELTHLQVPNARPIEGADNIGVPGNLNANPAWDDEGGIFSRYAHRVPGINAVAGMHDGWMRHMACVSSRVATWTEAAQGRKARTAVAGLPLSITG